MTPSKNLQNIFFAYIADSGLWLNAQIHYELIFCQRIKAKTADQNETIGECKQPKRELE